MLIEERKNRRKKKKGKDSEEAYRETALRAGTQRKKILGVCHYFQSERGCNRGDNCSFEHRKLSEKEAKELKARIDKRRKEKNSTADGEEEKYPSPNKEQSESAQTNLTQTTQKNDRPPLTKEEISRLADELEKRGEGSG